MAWSPAVAAVVVVLTTAAIWKGSDWLESSSERLSRYYGLPPVVQGSVVVAIGSSFPELASVVVAALEGSVALGVGAIVGSAIFNVLVIPAAAGLATATPVESNRTLVYKEAQFYMLAVSTLLITFAFAVIYVPGTAPLTGSVTRPLALIPLGLYALYLFIQYQDTAEYVADPAEARGVDPLRQWAFLAAGLLVILVAVENLVHAVRVLGSTFGVSEFVLGVVIVAGATSLPDTLVSVRAARAGRGVTSLANVLGSNTFDLLVAIPVGVLIAGPALIDFAVAAPMFGVLTAATVLLFTVMRTDLSLDDREAAALLGCYVVFVAWVVAETVGVGPGLLPVS
ncbi:sodium:calcium antiporter [Halomarina ordinaria]|uniref:Sodium:calcium antiporter n=1 Tax=Halomarina ordinaria TaxID=3033939 RepID=A0ABD5UFS1_9EURY|nr:sodium:calcium antiporter [Halomarina sp. PSRA2]